jgi:hypothetical protein
MHGSPLIRRTLLLALLASALATIAPIARGQTAAESAGVLVLRNGNVLQGTVRRLGEHFQVEHAGAVLQVPGSQVEMACASLVEAYELRRQSRVGSSVDANFELARWCLKNNMIEQAAREVLDARIRDPGHPALPRMDMKIRLALEMEASRQEQAAKAAAEQQAALAAEATAAVSSTAMLTPSPEAQTQFVRSIQPMLVNSCATGGCHQPGATQVMQLDRWALEGNGNPELIRRNLEAVLAQINAADPASSSLLIRARKAHGDRRQGVSRPIATYQAALLHNWMNLASGIRPEPAAEEFAPPLPADADVPPATSGGVDGTPPTAARQPSSTPAPASAKFVPRDAFDPEIFNRQVAKAPAAPSAQAAEVGATNEGAASGASDDAEALVTEADLAEIQALMEQ